MNREAERILDKFGRMCASNGIQQRDFDEALAAIDRLVIEGRLVRGSQVQELGRIYEVGEGAA